MGAWLRSMWTDQTQFITTIRSLIAFVGAVVAANPESFGGWGKYGGVLVAVSLKMGAGERNSKGRSPAPR